MNGFTLRDKFYREDDLKSMSLNDLQVLVVDIQSEIHRLAKQKQRLSTLPNSKKNEKTLSKVSYFTQQLMDLQDANNLVSVYKKQKRDTMSKEKEYFKTFFNLAKNDLRKGQFEKLVEITNSTVGYSVNL